MNDRVYKYGPLFPSPDPQELELPPTAEILHFAADLYGACWVWAIVNPDEVERERRSIAIVGTGWDIPNHHVYKATTITQDGLVWHLFERF